MWKVLVVDDNAANRELLIEILAGRAKCEIATNGREAMTMYIDAVSEGRTYDLVLLDIAMPEVDGLEFLSFVRDTEQKAGVHIGEGLPVIMITAFEKEFMKAFDRGCDDYILKPVNAMDLLAKINVKLAGRG